MSESEDTDGFRTSWDGYSDYEFVSRRMGKSIDEAVDAYAAIESMHREGDRIRPADAASARRDILAAVIRVIVEIESQEEPEEEFGDILERWQGEEGFIERLETIRLANNCPKWLYQLVLDIRTAGWKLGYLKAGRETRERTEATPETDAKEMFENL